MEAPSHTKKQAKRTIGLGNMTEAVLGGIVVLLTILALLNVVSMIFLSISVIAAGAGLLFQGSTIATEYANLLSSKESGDLNKLNMENGATVELVTGGIGLALGILALLGLGSQALTAVAAIVLGAGLAISGKSITQLNHVKKMHSGSGKKAKAKDQKAMGGAAKSHMMIGLAAVILGILSIIGVASTLLSIIALLAIGTATVLSGLAVSGSAKRSVS